jgi:hypothetical protein
MKKNPQQLRDARVLAIAILTKLGGDQFVKSTGAGRLEALDNGVLFAIPNHLSKHGINRVKIRKNEQRTYDLRFIKVDKEKYTHVDVTARANIQGEALRAVFTEVTGLALDL